MSLLPLPAPETPAKIALAARAWQRRLGAALAASGIAGSVVALVYWLACRKAICAGDPGSPTT